VLVDTHCHLDFYNFDNDLAQVLQRAEERKLMRIINPGVDLSSSQAAVDLANKETQIFAAVGVHPNESMAWNDESLARLKELAGQPKVVAIGEIGLDYYRDRAPKSRQLKIFHEQLDLAAEIELPVVIHNREATDDVLEVLEVWHRTLVNSNSKIADRPGVLHSFSGNGDHALKALELNFFLGISGPITFKNAVELHQVVRDAPMENLLIETDAPFLTPHPYRGKRNEPSYVYYVAERIAELRGMTIDEVASITTSNAQRLFLL
jgi:TatD DNase family protein